MASPAATAVGAETVSSSSAACCFSGSDELKESALKKQKLLHEDDDGGAFVTAGGPEVGSSSSAGCCSSGSDESKESALEKQKLGGGDEEEERMQVEEKDEGDAGEDEEGYPDCNRHGDSESDSDNSEELREQFRRYDKQIEESEGFDVDFEAVPKVRFFGGVRPIYLHLCDPLHKKALQESVEAGIRFYNQEKKTNLEFVEILKANFSPCSGHIFYITFRAKDSGELKTFQTKVFYGWNADGFCINVKFTRQKLETNPQ